MTGTKKRVPDADRVKSLPIGIRQDGRIGQTLRLYPDAWKLLKQIAAEEECRVHDLLLEGVNHVFTARKKKPLA